MDSDSTILDSGLIATEFDPRDCMATAGARFANTLLDTLIFYAVMFLIGYVGALAGLTIPTDTWMLQLISLLIFFLYYFTFESTIGKTPAKFITRTRVVNDRGDLPVASSIAGRTLSRMVPFDAFSFLGNFVRGWHDRWSNTWVIDERKLAAIQGTES